MQRVNAEGGNTGGYALGGERSGTRAHFRLPDPSSLILFLCLFSSW